MPVLTPAAYYICEVKMTIRKWAFFITIFLALSTAALYFYKEYRSTHFSCTAYYTATYDDASFISRSSLTMSGSKGIWIMDGKITYSDKKPSYFKIRNNFRVKHEGNNFQFFSEHVTIVPLNNVKPNLLDVFVNDAILHEKMSTFYSFYPINDAIIIYTGGLPIMYCMRKKHLFFS
ncbi:hypothetical protein ACT7BH_003005 [Cronobacter turicensis]